MEPYLQVPGVLLCACDCRGELVQTNLNWFEVLGYSPDELQAVTFPDLIHPEDLKHCFGGEFWFDSELAETGFTARLRHKDGYYRWIRWHTHRGPDLMLIYAVGVDVTVHTNGMGIADDGF